MPMATREEQRAYQREWYARRRAEYLTGMICVDCHSPDDLELDHRDPATKVSHNIWSWRHERIFGGDGQVRRQMPDVPSGSARPGASASRLREALRSWLPLRSVQRCEGSEERPVPVSRSGSWTLKGRGTGVGRGGRMVGNLVLEPSPLPDLNRRPLPYHGRWTVQPKYSAVQQCLLSDTFRRLRSGAGLGGVLLGWTLRGRAA
jgi:hypothetical protein